MELNQNRKEEEQKEQLIQELGSYLYQEKRKRGYLELVFLCIGTDRMTGDCFGPLVGSKLKERLEQYNIFNISIYGTLKENVCYTNIKEIIKLIETRHPQACLVVIDAALATQEKIGNIFVNREKMVLGKGLNKSKIEVGDISIKAVVGKNYKLPNYNFSHLQNISLNVVITLADMVAEAITEVIKYV